MNDANKSLSLTAESSGLKLSQKVGLGIAGSGILLLMLGFIASYEEAKLYFWSSLFAFTAALFVFYASDIQAPSTRLSRGETWGLGIFAAGLFFSTLSLSGMGNRFPTLLFWLGTGFTVVGGAVYFLKKYGRDARSVSNNGVMESATTARGAIGWLLGIVITGFYIILYWFPGPLEGLIRTMDPLSWVLRGRAADQWFLYGAFYTIAVLVMGFRMILKHRYSKYQVLRTLSVMFFQLGFAFILPALLLRLNQPEFYFSYFWPLDWDLLFPSSFANLLAVPGGVGLFMLIWGALLTFIATPILTYFYGKRWYCSWVCGCGGLAETLGDPWRQLSDKSLKAWQVERWMIHSVLVFITVTTLALWINAALEGALLGTVSGVFSSAYGFLIGSVFAGVIGVGFYPLMGSRVWCRFGCPMAAVLGILQKYFSRFRITTNGGQCISCGNCSTYCEMGIDVRWYAQRGQPIIRASCVGCGICSSVCPRGVLNLENGPREGRYAGPMLITADDITVLSDERVP